jgi:hypothetical protein
VSGAAAKLTKARRDYLRAVAACEGQYYQRHGCAANWALRRKLVQTMIETADGEIMPWDALTPEQRAGSVYLVGGQMLTPLGLAILQDQSQ